MSKSGTRWNEREFYALHQHYPEMSMSKLVRLIGRTPAAIVRQASREGLKRSFMFWFRLKCCRKKRGLKNSSGIVSQLIV